MVTIEGEPHFIKNYTPEEVFEAGLHTENWPKHVDGLKVVPGKEPLELRSKVPVEIDIVMGKTHTLIAEVIEFIPCESVIIEGESNLARVALFLSLLESKKPRGTIINRSIDLTSKKRLIPESVMKARIAPKAKEFEDEHCLHVEAYLAEHAIKSTPKKTAAA